MITTLCELPPLRCPVTLCWIPGHSGHEGNEIADRLANEGSSADYNGPEYSFGYGLSDLKCSLDEWVEKMKAKNFQGLPSNSVSRRFIGYDRKRTKVLMALSRSELRAITGYLTGHCRLRNHMVNMRLMQDRTCRKCGAAAETAEHLLCDCPALAATRLKQSNFGVDFPTPKQLIGVTPRKILQFFRELKLVEN